MSNWNQQKESEQLSEGSAGAAPEPKNPWASFIAGMEARATEDECCQGACSEELASELDAASDRVPELVTPEHSLPAMPAVDAELPAAEEKKAKKAVAKKKPAKKAAAKKKPAKKAAAKKKPAKKGAAKKKAALAAGGEQASDSMPIEPLLPPKETAA